MHIEQSDEHFISGCFQFVGVSVRPLSSYLTVLGSCVVHSTAEFDEAFLRKSVSTVEFKESRLTENFTSVKVFLH